MFGILNVHKPPGVTSRDVVNQVERLIKPEKAGHAGTLDPLATGVLVVCVGPATRLIEYVQRLPKRYLGTFLLGRRSATEDIEGEVEELVAPPQPTREQLAAALPQFLGRIMQQPPAFSALKVAGKRAYDLARRGEEVNLAPRPIDVFSLEITNYAYPELQLDIRCGSGTYVRSLGRDLARAVGTEAVMSALIRTEIGAFTVATAVAPYTFTRDNLHEHLLPPQSALASLPQVTVSEREIADLRNGKRIPVTADAGTEAALVDAAGRLIALASRAGDAWQPNRVFPAPAEIAGNNY